MFDFFKNKIKGVFNKFESKEEIKEVKPQKDVGLKTKITKAIVGKVKLSENEIDEFLDDFEILLVQADVAKEVSEKICKELKETLLEKEFERKENISKVMQSKFQETIENILNENKEIDLIEKTKQKKPLILLFLGPNGAGKTTTLAKICKMFLDNNLKCVFAASDTFRAASIEQLEEHANKLSVKIIKQQYGADPTAVAFDSVKYAKANNIDVVLIDSAGRQETNVNLIEQMKKMGRVIQPDLKIFVGEATTGNALLEQIKAYNEAVGIDGAILSKLDLDVKGGGVISILFTKIPLIYFGIGQNYEDIKKFDKEFLMKNLFGE